jgi:hypothetical protein
MMPLMAEAGVERETLVGRVLITARVLVATLT